MQRRFGDFFLRLTALQQTRCARRRERGFSAVELLVLTAPLCVLSLAITSKLAAIGSAHIRAGWQASLAAQQGSRAPCGSNPNLDAPWHPDASPNTATETATSAAHIGLSPAVNKMTEIQANQNRIRQGIGPLTQQEARSREAAERLGQVISAVNLILALASFAMTELADIPDDILNSPELVETNWRTKSVRAPIAGYYFQPYADRLLGSTSAVAASATFVCNESDGGDSRRDKKRGQLIGFATEQAQDIFF